MKCSGVLIGCELREVRVLNREKSQNGFENFLVQFFFLKTINFYKNYFFSTVSAHNSGKTWPNPLGTLCYTIDNSTEVLEFACWIEPAEVS